jgi:lactate dehydrogenase-like 2-hydroxyacid dehydrogenase
MSDRPRIVTHLPMLEQEYQERLAAAGEVISISPGAHELLRQSMEQAHAFLGYYAVDAAFLDAAPALRVVATPSVGYDSIDVAAATARGVAVCNTPGVLTAAVADLTVALIIMLARRLPEYARFVRSGAWARREPLPELAHDIAGKTLGVVGFGRIGREVARRMQLLGMQPIWYDVFDRLPPGAPQVPYRPLDELLAAADFVTIHMDLNDSSRHLIGARELGLMRPTAHLVNTARGGVVDQSALASALREGRLAGAGLDVLEQEPPAPAEPILALPNIIAFPHMGTATHETRKAMRELAVDNVLAVLAGRRPPAIVNPEVVAAGALA